MESGANLLYCIKCIETFKADHDVCREKGMQAAKSSREGVGV